MDVEKKARDRRSPQGGFTLIELLAVILVILMLMALTVGVIQFARQAAHRAHARAELEELHKVITNFKFDDGEYPDTLYAVRTRLPQGFRTEGTNSAVTFHVLDPWERPYEYTLNTPSSYVLYSLGPKPGISDDDIYSGR